MNYQWYPGHMMKAKRMMQENISLIDVIIELVDARVPISSRNPDLEALGRGKARVILLNKSDLADPIWNKRWKEYFQEKGYLAIETDSKAGGGLKGVQKLVGEACLEKKERDRRRGIINRPVRAMVVGIPNVGKSTFINSFVGKASAKTGNKPGVTKGKQWIRLNASLELLDTPGILWPKFEDPKVGRNLAFIGSMNDQLLVPEEVACELLTLLNRDYPEALPARYQTSTELSAAECLKSIAILRKCLGKGGEPDLEKAAGMVLDDFRKGKLGFITIERCEPKERK
jgi:ribosome biogenesis GTPase A